jgi:hypothetical protein
MESEIYAIVELPPCGLCASSSQGWGGLSGQKTTKGNMKGFGYFVFRNRECIGKDVSPNMVKKLIKSDDRERQREKLPAATYKIICRNVKRMPRKVGRVVHGQVQWITTSN